MKNESEHKLIDLIELEIARRYPQNLSSLSIEAGGFVLGAKWANERLKQEVSRLTKENETNNEWRREQTARMLAEQESLQSEVARLREALEVISVLLVTYKDGAAKMAYEHIDFILYNTPKQS